VVAAPAGMASRGCEICMASTGPVRAETYMGLVEVGVDSSLRRGSKELLIRNTEHLFEVQSEGVSQTDRAGPLCGQGL